MTPATLEIQTEQRLTSETGQSAMTVILLSYKKQDWEVIDTKSKVQITLGLTY